MPADNYLSGKQGFVAVPGTGATLNTTTGVLSGNVTGAASNGAANLIRLTVTNMLGLLTTNSIAVVAGVLNTTEANGQWRVTVISNTSFDLQGSTFTNAFNNTTLGWWGFGYAFDDWKLSLKAILPEVTNFTSFGYQAVLSGIVSGDITVSGPYNAGNMPFTVGTQYTWSLGFSPTIMINVPALVGGISPDNSVKTNPKITITATSNGPFSASIV